MTCVADEMKKEYSEPSECKMIASLCKKPLDVWSLGMLGTCIDAPAAIRFGNSSFKSFVFEVGFEKSDEIYFIISPSHDLSTSLKFKGSKRRARFH